MPVDVTRIGSAGDYSSPFTMSQPPLEKTPWHRSYRSQIFAATFLLVMVVGSILNFARPAIYRSEAVVLTTVQTELDTAPRDVDLEYVVIQQKLLTGLKLLDETLKRAAETGVDYHDLPADSFQFESMLAVSLVPETNLVELSIEGPHAQALPVLINGLITTYSELRNEAIALSVTNTNESLTEQKLLLEQKILKKRDDIDDYRAEHNILSLARDENQVYARLGGLTESLNKASEEVVTAKARRNAIHAALARGEPVVPAGEEQSLTVLEVTQQRLQGELAELDSRYTREYMARRPSMQAVIQQLADVEKQIKQKISVGKKRVLSQIEREYEAAVIAQQSIQQQLDEHKQKAIEFSARFAEHEAMKEELLQLEASSRELLQRLTSIDIKQQQRYPQIEVIESGYLPTRSVRPDYWRDTGLLFLVAFFLGLAAIWFYEFVRRSGKDDEPPAPVQPNIFAMTEARLPSYPADLLEQGHRPVSTLPEPDSKPEPEEIVELDLYKMDRLLEAADLETQQVIALVLSGFTLAELVALSLDDIHVENDKYFITGSDNRVIRLSAAVANLLEQTEGAPFWLQKNEPCSTEQLEALLRCAAVDAGIDRPVIDSETIRHSYIGYLVREGIKLSELAKLVGVLSPVKRAEYAKFSPPGAGLVVDQINPVYPALQNGIV